MPRSAQRTLTFDGSAARLNTATRKLARPDLLIARLPNSLRLLSLFVLIDGDHFAVGENLENRWTHTSQIVPGQQRRGKHRPKAHVRFIFSLTHSAVADLEHV